MIIKIKTNLKNINKASEKLELPKTNIEKHKIVCYLFNSINNNENTQNQKFKIKHLE